MAGRSTKRSARSLPRRNPALLVAWVVSAALVLLFAAPARAQDTTFYLDRLQVGGAPDDGVAIWRPHVDEKTRIYGQFGLGFSLNPFRIENHIENPSEAARMNQLSGAPVKTQLIGYPTIGVEFLKRFALQMTLPIAFLQTGNETNPTAGVGTDNVDLVGAAVHDLRVQGRAQLFQTDDRAFKLGILANGFLPSGNEKSWTGDKTASGGVGVGLEYDFDVLLTAFNTGVHFRPQASVNDFGVGNEWTWGLGAFLPLRDGQIRLGLEVFGSTGIASVPTRFVDSDTFFSGDNTPLEWMLEGRIHTDDERQGHVGLAGGTRLTPGYAPDFRVIAQVGYWFRIFDTDPASPPKGYRAETWRDDVDTDKDGLPDDVDLCPTEPEDGKPPNTDDGCPALPDADGDGIPDISDKCPNDPEDFDKIDDFDGCPEDDADEDDIPDAKDACPKEPGEASDVAEKNGCPQFIRRISGSSEIEILKQVQFATGSATILPTSYPILDEVYRLLDVNEEITLLSIEGHTDDRGSDELNDKLSKDRAASCMNYLVQKGIEPGRLTSDGFGERKPLADNNTAEGRQKNRRVEFHIRNQGLEGVKPEKAPDAE